MASEVIQHAERLKRLLNQDDGTLTTEVTNFLNKYAVPAATPLVQASSRAFNDTDLYELLLDKGRDILPAELFSRFMMFYATLDDTITIPLFNEFGGIAEILMTMDSKIDQPSVVAAGAQVLAVLAERDVNLRTEIGAGDGMGLLVEALEAHKDNPISSVALMAALTNMMYNHFENKGTFLQQNGLHILMEVLTRNSAADRAGVVTSALCLLRNLTNLDQVRSMEATKAVHLTRDLLPILNKFINNEKLIQHGAWALLNLLHGSQQNKVILTDRGGLEFVSKSLSIWKTTSVRVVEPVCLVVQQLAKLAINRTALVDKGVVPLLVSVMEHNRSSEGVVVLLPAAKSLYRLSFNAKNRKVIGGSGAISHLLWPLNNALASPKLHRVIARALLKLCREDENKDVIRNEGGVGAIVTSMNYFRDNPSVTALMVRAMNCLFVKDGGASSPASKVTPSSPQQRPSSSSDSDSDGESPENSDSDTDSPRTPPDSASGLDDLEKIAANIMSPKSDESDEADSMDVNLLVETLVSPAADVVAGLKDDALTTPAITVVETDSSAPREHKDPAMPSVVEGDEDEEARKEKEREEAEQALAAARAEAEADFAAEQARLKEEEAKLAQEQARNEAEAKAKREADEAAALQKKRDEEELAKKKREEEEAAAKKKAEEEAAAAAAAAKKKAEEEAAAAAKKKAEEEAAAAAAAAKKKAEEEAAAAAAAKKKADEEAAAAAAKKRAEEEAAAAAKKRADEEAAAARKQAEQEAAAAAARKKQEEEAAAAAALKKKQEEEAALAAKKRADEEAARAAAAKKEAEDRAALEAKRREDEKRAAEAAAAKAEADRKAAEAKKADEDKKRQQEADQKAKEAELRRRNAAKSSSSATPKPDASTTKPAGGVSTKTVVVAVAAAALAVGTWFLTTWNK